MQIATPWILYAALVVFAVLLHKTNAHAHIARKLGGESSSLRMGSAVRHKRYAFRLIIFSLILIAVVPIVIEHFLPRHAPFGLALLHLMLIIAFAILALVVYIKLTGFHHQAKHGTLGQICIYCGRGIILTGISMHIAIFRW